MAVRSQVLVSLSLGLRLCNNRFLKNSRGVSLLRSHLHMAFPERDRWRAAAARKERVWGEKILTEGEGEGRKERGKN